MPDPDIISRIVPADGKNRLLFFTGKGGVGKTVMSAATAVWLARRGQRTLLVSTDPASHLSQVLEEEVGAEPRRTRSLPRLEAARVDPRQAAAAYKERVLAEASQRYSPELVAAMAEELNSPCTEEMAAFEKFVHLATMAGYEVIIFDTAPTGHTLRLLELPFEWERQLQLMVAARPGTEVHRQAQDRYHEFIRRLRDPGQTTFIFVVYPENTPVVEAHRASRDLQQAGIPTGLVVANQVLPPEQCDTPFFARRRQVQEKYLGRIRELFRCPVAEMPLLAEEIKGLRLLSEAGKLLWEQGNSKNLQVEQK